MHWEGGAERGEEERGKGERGGVRGAIHLCVCSYRSMSGAFKLAVTAALVPARRCAMVLSTTLSA